MELSNEIIWASFIVAFIASLVWGVEKEQVSQGGRKQP